MNNKGAALMLAIFMLIVFAIIGAAVVTMLTTSSITSSEDLISSQALFMAESGAEIRIKDFLNNSLTDNKTYSYNGFTMQTGFINSDVQAIGKKIYLLKSTASKDNIRRAIKIKFWKKN